MVPIRHIEMVHALSDRLLLENEDLETTLVFLINKKIKCGWLKLTYRKLKHTCRQTQKTDYLDECNALICTRYIVNPLIFTRKPIIILGFVQKYANLIFDETGLYGLKNKSYNLMFINHIDLSFYY